MSQVDHQLTREILATLRDAGFALYGICAAAETSRREEFGRWLDEVGCGDMAYLTEHVEQRMDPGRFVPTARSIICVADRYASGEPDERRPGASPRGRVARYARGRDYHRVIRDRLEPIADDLRRRYPGNRFRVCVDTAPILEREHAQRAGLGRIGKHTLLIGEEGVGSWIVLGEIVTSLNLAPAPAAAGDPCGSCTRCIDACPTSAIEPWKLNAQRCISYLTIEHRAAPAEWFRRRSDDWLFGCDACIEACPHSQPRQRSARIRPNPEYQARHADFDLADVLQWSGQSQAEMKLSKVLLRAKLSMWKRNALLILEGTDAATWSERLVAALHKISGEAGEEPWLQAQAAALLRRVGR